MRRAFVLFIASFLFLRPARGAAAGGDRRCRRARGDRQGLAPAPAVAVRRARRDPPGGVVIGKDTATWTLESGTVSLMEPVGGSRVTGYVFEGKGRFSMAIPDRFELAQLRRFTQQPAIERVDEPFTRLVVRTTGPLPPALAAATPSRSYAPSTLARDRHEAWLKYLRQDVDARVVAGLLTPGDDYLLVDADTAGFGWLAYEWEPAASQEQITLFKIQKLNEFVEQWVSLARPEERDAAGRPTSSRHSPIHITHVDIDVNLTKHGGSVPSLQGPPLRDKAFFRCRMTFQPLAEGIRALQLRLESNAKVTAGRTRRTTARVPRDHIGARFASIDNEIYDGSLIVLLDRPLVKGEESQLDFEYEMKTYNYVFGRGWYPGTGTAFTDRHTSRLTFTLPKKFDVRAVGVPETDRIEGDVKKAVWVMDRPTSQVAFSFGESFKEEKLKIEGVPEVVSFGTSGGLFSGGMVRNVGVDIANSLNFYQRYFDVEIPAQRIYATAIQGNHGQAFDGFLHLSAYTYDAEHPGASSCSAPTRRRTRSGVTWLRPSRTATTGSPKGSRSTRRCSSSRPPWPRTATTTRSSTSTATSRSVRWRAASPSSRGRGTSSSTRPTARSSAPSRLGTGPVPRGFRARRSRRRTTRARSSSICCGRCSERIQDGERVPVGHAGLPQAVQREGGLHRRLPARGRAARQGRLAGVFRHLGVRHRGADLHVELGCPKTAGPDGRYDLTVTVKQSDVPSGFSSLVRSLPSLATAGTVFVFMDQPEKTFHISIPAPAKKVVFDPRHAVLARLIS